jgi:hypothetical protein
MLNREEKTFLESVATNIIRSELALLKELERRENERMEFFKAQLRNLENKLSMIELRLDIGHSHLLNHTFYGGIKHFFRIIGKKINGKV